MQKNQSLEFGKFYHIYNRGINSENLFKENRNHEYFLMLYKKHIDPIAETYAWCLLKNHFHLLVRIKSYEEILQSQKEKNIKKTIVPHQSFGNLFNTYTKAINKSYNRHGALFERPFKRKLIDNITYLCAVIKYIHNNPINHGFCTHPIEYPWSSYLSCISEKPTKLKRKEVISLFKNIDNLKAFHDKKGNLSFIENYLNL